MDDLSGNRFGKLTVVELLEDRTANHQRRWLCRCDCGQTCTPTTNSLNTGNTTSCGCTRHQKLVARHAKRRGNLLGELFGYLEVLKMLEERTKDDKVLWLCECQHPDDTGACGLKVKVDTYRLKSGHTQTCGHHHLGWFHSNRPVFVRRVEIDGEWWILPKVAAKIWGIARTKAPGRAKAEGVRMRPHITGANQQVMYWSEKDVNRVRDKYTLSHFPDVEGHVPMRSACKVLNRSARTIRDAAAEREVTLLRVKGKNKRGWPTRRTYVPSDLINTLMVDLGLNLTDRVQRPEDGLWFVSPKRAMRLLKVGPYRPGKPSSVQVGRCVISRLRNRGLNTWTPPGCRYEGSYLAEAEVLRIRYETVQPPPFEDEGPQVKRARELDGPLASETHNVNVAMIGGVRVTPPMVFPWLDSLAPPADPPAPAAGDESNGDVSRIRPAEEKHRTWDSWRSDGLTYGQIRKRHQNETGEDVTREAIILAIRRLRKRPKRKGC